METPLGPMCLNEEQGAVTALRFLKAGEGEAMPRPSGGIAAEAQVWLRGYFAGSPQPCRLPLAPVGTAFQQRVWRAAEEIPFGETVSYGELAGRIGCGSARAVGAALGHNPIWIMIPCHRVIGADGGLRGYAGGLEKKGALLHLERSV